MYCIVLLELSWLSEP